MADAVADPGGLSERAARDLLAHGVLGRCRPVCVRARAVLGGRPRRRNPVQLVAGPDEAVGRLYSGARRHEWNVVRICTCRGGMAILAITGLAPDASINFDRCPGAISFSCRGLRESRVSGPAFPESMRLPQEHLI